MAVILITWSDLSPLVSLSLNFFHPLNETDRLDDVWGLSSESLILWVLREKTVGKCMYLKASLYIRGEWGVIQFSLASMACYVTGTVLGSVETKAKTCIIPVLKDLPFYWSLRGGNNMNIWINTKWFLGKSVDAKGRTLTTRKVRIDPRVGGGIPGIWDSLYRGRGTGSWMPRTERRPMGLEHRVYASIFKRKYLFLEEIGVCPDSHS